MARELVVPQGATMLWLNQNRAPHNKVGDAAQPAPAPAPAAAQPTVSIKDFAFEPAELRIKAGQSVLWKNDGEKRHSATAVDGSFDTGLFGKGESKSVQFNLPGTFVYFC